jgi:hypothetical protein
MQDLCVSLEAATRSELDCMAIATRPKWITLAIAASLSDGGFEALALGRPALGLFCVATIVNHRRPSRRHR